MAVHLRRVEPQDLQALFDLQSDPDSNNMAGTKPRSREAFFAAWNGYFNDPQVNARVIELGSELVGSIALASSQKERDKLWKSAREYLTKSGVEPATTARICDARDATQLAQLVAKLAK